jgi:hypothetical protein
MNTTERRVKNYAKESCLEERIRLYAEERGCLFYKWIGAVKGVPDRILITPLGTVFVELKVQKNTLSAMQELQRDKIMQAGGNYVLAREMGDLREWLPDLK